MRREPGPRAYAALLVAICALALGLRVAALRSYEEHHPLAERPLIDEASYDRWAREVAAGDWLGDRVFFQEPLYPYALGLVYACGSDATRLARARRVQVVLGTLTVLLVGALGRELFGRRAGLLAALFFAVHPPALFMPLVLLKATLVLPCVSAIALVLARGARRGWTLASALGLGALAGLGALLRGNLLILIPAFVLWPLAQEACLRRRGAARPPGAPRPWRAALAVAGGVALALAPVVLRNAWVGGEAVLTTSGAGTNFYGGNNADNPYGLATEFDWVRGIPEHEPDDWRREAERRTGRALSPSEVSSYWLEQALASMRADPGMHLAILWRKLRLALSSYEVPDNHNIAWDARYVAPLRWPLGGFGVYGWLGLAGLAAFLVRRAPLADGPPADRRAGLAVALFFGLYLATIVLTVVSMRIRLALVPLLLPFAADLVLRLFALARRPSWRCAAPALVGLAVAAAFVHVPVFGREQVAAELDERDHNLAVQLVRDGDLAGARAIAERLLALHPRAPRVVLLLADVDFREGVAALDAAQSEAERSAARAQVDRAAARIAERAPFERAQDRYRADYLTGAIEELRGRWREAALAYERARAFDPDERDLAVRAAVAAANAALAEPAGAARRAGLERALAILREVQARGSEASLAALIEQIEAAR